MRTRSDLWRGLVVAALLAEVAVWGTPACGFDLGMESSNGAAAGKKDGGKGDSGTGALGGSWPGNGGAAGDGASSGGSGASTTCGDGKCQPGETMDSCPADCLCGNGKCDANQGETAQTCAVDCYCGNGACNTGESCGSCPADCPPGGTKDCYDNGLSSNCCSGPNTNTAECLACNNEVGCPSAEYAAYCDRFSPGDNLWQKYHRNWVESQCGGSAQSDGDKWYCTDASTCTTYTCAM